MLSHRILFVAPPVGPLGSGEGGGVETHLLQLLPVLAARGYHIGLVAPAGSLVPDPAVEVFAVPGCPAPSATRARRETRAVPQSDGVLENMWERAFALQSDYDVLIGLTYDWLAFYLTPFFSTPVGHWLTVGSLTDEMDAILEKRWREGCLNLALYTTAQARTFSFLPADRVHLLYGAVDTAVFRYNSEPGPRLCWAARISPEKGLEDAIAAARTLGMPLDVCGKIQDRAYWESVLRDAQGMEVIYRGFLSAGELRDCFAGACASLVTPHWLEAFGNTVVESLACGTPVVAYDAGGPAEIVEDGKSGALVPPGDVPGLAEGVRRAMCLDRRAVRARAEEFSFGRMADRFEGWLRSFVP